MYNSPALFSRPGLQNPYPFLALVSRLHSRLQSLSPKWLKSIPYFKLKRVENHTLWRRTYLFSLYGRVLRNPSLRYLPDVKRGEICYRENIRNFAIGAECQAWKACLELNVGNVFVAVVVKLRGNMLLVPLCLHQIHAFRRLTVERCTGTKWSFQYTAKKSCIPMTNSELFCYVLYAPQKVVRQKKKSIREVNTFTLTGKRTFGKQRDNSPRLSF